MKKTREHNMGMNIFFSNNPDEKETYAKDFTAKGQERKGNKKT